ncbi:MAG TPA: transglycosylase SLT domain-containing protein [Acidobacteriaceae bacterium]|nr:transglycosylase SLT domain-containing protein [Acidobacteriaceae bacterium]
MFPRRLHSLTDFSGIRRSARRLSCLLCLVAFALLLVPRPGFAEVHGQDATTPKTTHRHTAKHRHVPSNAHASHRASSVSSRRRAYRRTAVHHRTRRHHQLTARELARSRRYRRAFVASSELRPMGQQLVQNPTPAAFAGVAAFAHRHTGDAAAAAYLALGHAYLLDHQFADAATALHEAHIADATETSPDGPLADYADYLTAQAYLQSSQYPQAETILSGYVRKYPDSIFVPGIPILEANLFVQEGDPQRALQTLDRHRSEPIAGHADFQLALAKAELLAGQTDAAQRLFEHVYLDYPLSIEAGVARAQLATSGALHTIPAADRRRHADALYGAGHYADAAVEYRSLAAESDVPSAIQTDLLVAAAECDWKLKRLTKRELEAIPDTNDEAAARRQYLLMEMARDDGDTATVQSIDAQMESRFPSSSWLNEALYSTGNMFLLLKDFPNAITYYGEVAKRFPASRYAPSAHWRTGWLNYRLGQYSEAARLFDEQIRFYAGGREIPSALYWRARIYEDQEHRPSTAAAYYKTILRVYPHYYYAMLAQDRLSRLGSVTADSIPALDALHPEPIPELSDDVPEDDPHVVKARLLANAGLNEYIAPEIQAADGSDEWGAFAEADIYAAGGEAWKAMRLLKRAIPFYTSAPIEALPVAYWRILFPEMYWSDIKADSEKNGLDPYMVASLIRQETEFNPGAVSNKSAYGLMQLLPSVGRAMAREEGIRHFETSELLNPATNIRLGTLYLRQMLEKFNNQPEYAFAAYNAGDDRVTSWQSIGNYHGMDEFVESIPFTETREYVQAILRNEEIYRELDKVTAEHAQR